MGLTHLEPWKAGDAMSPRLACVSFPSWLPAGAREAFVSWQAWQPSGELVTTAAVSDLPCGERGREVPSLWVSGARTPRLSALHGSACPETDPRVR